MERHGPSEPLGFAPDARVLIHSDYAFLMSSQARELPRREGIHVIDYGVVQEVWARRPGT
ncbi:hypothetical protein [Streptomyces sp. NPDC005322]|uniref:hypothetical protein n=1 Tax=unclassified Streptomyces TaxID=2593676 RepID=UPI0033BA26C1